MVEPGKLLRKWEDGNKGVPFRGDVDAPPRPPEDNGEHYTYIYNPNGIMIELVYYPLGWKTRPGIKQC